MTNEPDDVVAEPTTEIEDAVAVEEAEAAIKSICKHINFLATQVEYSENQPIIMGVMKAVADTLKPNNG